MKPTMTDRIFREPYGLLGSRLFKWLFTLTVPLFSFFYIFIEEPLGLRLFTSDEILKIALLFSIPVALIWGTHLFLLLRRIAKSLTLFKTLVWIGWINLTISVYYFAIGEIYILGRSEFDWSFFPELLSYSMMLGGAIALFFMVIYGIKKHLSQEI